jgi:hypothetical protein
MIHNIENWLMLIAGLSALLYSYYWLIEEAERQNKA